MVPSGMTGTKLAECLHSDNLANLEVMLYTVGTFGEKLPEACRGTCEQAWEVLDAFFLKYGIDPDCAESATRVIRQGLSLFGNTALPVLPSVINRMASAFESTSISSYLWVIGKIIQSFGNEEDPALRVAFRDAYERTTRQVVMMLSAKEPAVMPDGERTWLLEPFLAWAHKTFSAG
jgi:transportin-3